MSVDLLDSLKQGTFSNWGVSYKTRHVQHDKCHLCDQKQTMNHLFVSCPDVQIFWQSFSRWWNVQNDDFIVLNDETIIYGFTNDFSQQLGLNLCLIIAKYYIYCASRDREISTSKPSLLILKANYLKKRVNANLKSTFFMGSNNYNNYIETYTTKKAVNEVRICASQSTYYYIQ